MDLPSNMRVKAMGKRFHSVCHTGLFQAHPDSIHINAVYPLRYVLCNTGFQDRKILEHGGKQAVVIPSVVLPDVFSVQQDASCCGIKESANKFYKGGLACAVWADDGKFFTGTDGQADMGDGVQRSARVSEGYVL